MTARLATPDDAAAIERIRTDTWRATYRGLMPDWVLDALGYDGAERRRRMAHLRPEVFVLVAEHDGEVVGFVNGGPPRVEDASDADAGEIYAIYVLPEHQGHGHGAALLRMSAREGIARGWRGMMLWVLRDNAPSRRFYEHMGGRYLKHRDTDREIEGVMLTESRYVWDDLSDLARA